MEYSRKIYTIDEVRNAISKLIKNEYPEIKEVILFGSYARDEATPISDLDILISKPEQIKPMIMWSFCGSLKEILHKSVEVFRLKSIDINSEFFENIRKDGILIYENKQNENSKRQTNY